MRGAFEQLLCHGGALVLVGPSAPGVVLPSILAGQQSVVLDYDIDPSLPVPIRDLETNQEGISATLSFFREPHKTFVPWSAVLAMAAKRQPAPEGRPKLRLV